MESAMTGHATDVAEDLDLAHATDEQLKGRHVYLPVLPPAGRLRESRTVKSCVTSW